LAGHGLNVRARKVTDGHTPAPPFRAVVYGYRLDSEDFANAWRQVCEMAAGLTSEDFSKSVALLWRSPLVEVESDLPFDLEHVAGRMGGQDGVQAVKAGVSEVAFVDVPGDQNGAFTFVWVGRETRRDRLPRSCRPQSNRRSISIRRT